MAEHTHKLKMTEPGTSSQKTEYICIKCKRPFAFYAWCTLEQTEEYVNQYYPETLKNILNK